MSVVRHTSQRLLNSVFMIFFAMANFDDMWDMNDPMLGMITWRIEVCSSNSLNSGERVNRNGKLLLTMKFKSWQIKYTTVETVEIYSE